VRASKGDGTRLLGLVELRKEEIALVEQQQGVYCIQYRVGDYHADNLNAGFSLDLVKVNHDGPSLRLNTCFSGCSTSHYGFHQINAQNHGKEHVWIATQLFFN
jgi:hypothetical protein